MSIRCIRLCTCAALLAGVGTAAGQIVPWTPVAPGARPLGPPSMAPDGGPLIDGLGDTFGAFPIQLDIDTISVTYVPSMSVTVLMTFHTPISAPSLSAPDSVVGLFEFDTDQLAATGTPPAQNSFSPPAPLLAGKGVDFFADLFSESLHPGMIDIFPSGPGLPSVVPIVYTPMSLSFTVPTAGLGGDDGLLNFSTIIGTPSEPTDATNAIGTSYIPAPGGAAMLGLAGLLAARRRR